MHPFSAIATERGESARPVIRPVPSPFRLLFRGRRRQGGGQSFRRVSSSSGFTLVELLATLFILGIIITITSMLLRETRLTASRLTENEESSYSAARAMDLLRRDMEHAVADSVFSNFVFVATNACVDTNAFYPDLAVGYGVDAPILPEYTNGTRVCMIVLNDTTNSAPYGRALSEVFYWLACTPTSACASLVRAEIPLDALSNPGAYTNPLWYLDPGTNLTTNEIVVRYVSGFSVRCTGRDGAVPTGWNSNELPVCVDVDLSYIPETAARRIHGRSAMTNLAEISNAVTRISGRMFLPNRRGYMDGK